MFFFFFFKQKTAYEMRISDWSSDVCSSDLCANCVDAAQRLVLTEGCQYLENAWGRRRAGDGGAQRLRHLAQLETVLVRVAPHRILDAAFLNGFKGPYARRKARPRRATVGSEQGRRQNGREPGREQGCTSGWGLVA